MKVFKGSIKLVFCLVVIIMSEDLLAAEPKKKEDAEVMSFEATVIEGERKNPSIFLDITIDKFSDLDSILLIRKHFNNFHLVDSENRTLYIY